MKAHLQHMLEYEYWANDIVFELVKEHASNHRKILETLHHIFEAQRVWVARIMNEQYSHRLFHSAAIGEIEAVKNTAYSLWKKVLSEKDADTAISYSNTSYVPFTNTLKEITTHVINHSTYHRGQIVTMLKSENSALKIPPTDYIFYLRK
jgi:uncharacterized damage-inducible protein DinB